MAIEVFVSRPTHVDDAYGPGLDGFLRLLEDKGFRPRTIGAVDYPTDCPLDEVIRVVRQCRGVIVLGYPQLFVERGRLRGTQLPSAQWQTVALPTEWNHIEAAIGYVLDRPLLVIHDYTVRRGVFDRGALPSFLYAVDLTDRAWPLQAQILGALETWKQKVSVSNLLAGFPEKAIDMEYAKFMGLEGLLQQGGYRLFWCRNEDVDKYVDFLGYERVVWTDPSGKEWLLTGSKDATPLKTRKSSEEVQELLRSLNRG